MSKEFLKQLMAGAQTDSLPYRRLLTGYGCATTPQAVWKQFTSARLPYLR